LIPTESVAAMKQSIFRASEILDMAVEIEKEGLAFYRAARENAASPVVEVLNFLIAQEEQHVRIFSEMKTKVDEHFLLPESYLGEREAFINSFVKDQVFYNPLKAMEQFRGVVDVLETIRIAIDFERRSILFYSWIKQIVRRSEGEAIDRIISEEHAHIGKLLQLRREFE